MNNTVHSPPTTVIHLATSHRLDDSRIYRKMAKSHRKMGFDTVIVMPDAKGPRKFQKESIEFNTASPFKNGTERYFNSTRELWIIVNRYSRDNSIIQFHDYDLLPHMIWASLLGWKVVYDAHEDMPRLIKIQHWVPTWFKPIFSLLLSLFEWVGGKLFDHIITATEIIARRFPDHKTTVIKNYPVINSSPHTTTGSSNTEPISIRNDLFYVGGISENKGVWDMINVVGLINEKQASSEQPHILHLCGPCYPSSLKQEIQSHDYSKYLQLHGWTNQSVAKALSQKCLAGFVLLHYLPQYNDALPTKLYEYMLYGLPAICSKTKPMIETITKYRCGYLFDPQEHDLISNSIIELMQQPGLFNELSENAMNAVKKHLNWNIEEQKLKNIYKGLGQ